MDALRVVFVHEQVVYKQHVVLIGVTRRVWLESTRSRATEGGLFVGGFTVPLAQNVAGVNVGHVSRYDSNAWL